MSQAIIGIDLGTTNTTLAYVLPGETTIEQLSIEQLLSKDTQGEALVLPSFLYFPLDGELKAQSHCVGTWARDRGTEVPNRLISSAKSWLCHSGIDRREAFLPLGHEESIHAMSPIQVSAEYLRHLRNMWNKRFSELPFDQQTVLITVPASFDPSARQLVQEAAEAAGYPEIILLEEPQAAFYAWLQRNESWRKSLTVGDRVLVVDIGGGTTDFSLIAVEEEEGNLTLQRIAVGAHLLLGGDNIDLSLAYLAKSKLEESGHVIDDWQMHALVHSCRRAKEELFSETPPKKVDITIMGRGSKLIGGSLKTSITLEEASTLILDGFLPEVSHEERSKPEQHSGLQQLGLPYAQDPRITCQLAKFLSTAGDAFVMPTAILFNGGTTKAAAFRQRLIDVLNAWAEQLGTPVIKILPAPDYDFAVSQGAVSYGLARQGKAIRIRSGLNRSYFIGVEDSSPAVPGIAKPMRAYCIAPFGMEEGSEGELANQEFSLVVGESAAFRFFSRMASNQPDQFGTAVRSIKELEELHPIETTLDREDTDGKTVRVKLKSKVTELGVLELRCVAADGRSWKLEFDTRKEFESVKA